MRRIVEEKAKREKAPKHSGNPWIIGIDPGLATCGAAILELRPKGLQKIVGLRFFATKKVQGETPSDALLRRGDELGVDVHNLLSCEPVALFVEEFSFLRAASANAMLNRAWGVIQATARQFRVPIIQIKAGEVKAAIAGAKRAEKRDLEHKLWRMYPDAKEHLDRFKNDVREHPGDALAIVSTGVVLARKLKGDARFDAVRAML